jgi:hypothetical protein
MRLFEISRKRLLASAVPALAALAVAAAGPALALDYGVNLHLGGGSATANSSVASIVAQRNLKVGRFDFFSTNDVPNLRDQILKINANGGKAQLIIENNWDAAGTCPQNFAQAESDSYNKTYPMVNAMKDIVHDFEILNEIQNRPEIMAQVVKNSQMSSTAGYYASPCSMTIAAVARGISRAIHDQGQRAILGVVGRDWGFLYFMRAQNVAWDVTGAHFYQNENNASLLSDPWWGTNGPLYQLSLFGKPITVNEFNCGETYNSAFDYEACLRSTNKQLTELTHNPYGTIESILFYELLDEPAKAGAEGRFGLMYGLTSPKLGLPLAGAWACGAVTDAERQSLASRGLNTGSGCTTVTPPPPAPAPVPPPAPAADTTPPAVTITNPANGRSFSTHAGLWVRASASDNVGVSSITFRLNGNTICAGTSTSCSMRLPKLVQANTIEVTARDAAGNIGRASVTVYTQ